MTQKFIASGVRNGAKIKIVFSGTAEEMNLDSQESDFSADKEQFGEFFDIWMFQDLGIANMRPGALDPLKIDAAIRVFFGDGLADIEYVNCERPTLPLAPEDTPENDALPDDDPRKVIILY